MSGRAPHVCPICAREVAPRNGTPRNPSFPFCSPACKVVDLGRWFDGTYRLPAPSDQDGADARITPGEGDGEERARSTPEEDE